MYRYRISTCTDRLTSAARRCSIISVSGFVTLSCHDRFFTEMSKSLNFECMSCRVRRFASANMSASDKNFKFAILYRPAYVQKLSDVCSMRGRDHYGALLVVTSNSLLTEHL